MQHEQARLKVEAGRFNYYLLDGNVIDKKVDGLRLRLGERTTGPGILTFFAGRTTGSDDRHRLRGWSLLYSSQHGRLKRATQPTSTSAVSRTCLLRGLP